ncbi:tetratricopeptide repeat protein [Adhaeribacter rhizoryzae]|uniref:Tetratricopeptide repeat protein n=1 Tax=Adhaeribacter rhizoryzae TaxID=2607907 RepID=A0A5M6D0I5_9BACT|nr:tetratricopeptide repeat protein [Adhaeribacter rhizoryzae]KAA5540803.1 tetratricopeptide repeat protein [Adhaeribacter rhizoryzae]
MRYFLLVLLFFSSVGDGLKKASRINEGVAKAQEYYLQQAYEQAEQQYNYLRNSLNVKDAGLLLNLAHATYLAGNLEKAQKYYHQLRNNPDADLQGAALNQLGILAYEDNNPEKALYFFRQAIIKNPRNEIARYNYELVKKYQTQNPARFPRRSANRKNPKEKQAAPQPKRGQGVSASEAGNPDFISDLTQQGQEPPQNKPQPEGPTDNQQNNSTGNKPDKQPVAGGDTPQNSGNQPGNTKGLNNNNNSVNPGAFGASENPAEITNQEQQMQTLHKRLGKTDLSPEKALLLLEAMQNAELQYLQQLPKPQPQSRQNKNKPDW